MKHVRRLRQRIESRREKGVEQGGEESCSPASASAATDQNHISTSPPVTLQSDPPSLNPPSTLAPFIRPADQLTEYSDLWKLAYDKFRTEQPDLAEDYNKHVLGDAAGSADLSSQEAVKTTLEQLLEGREKKQWKVSFLGQDIKIRVQVTRLTKLLKWSDPLVKAAVSTQPYAALAWSGVSLLLPLLTSSTTQNEAMLDGFNSVGELQKFWKTCEETSLQSEHRQHYQRLTEGLVKLYSLVFAYQAYVICHLSKAQLSRAWEDLRSPDFWTNKLDEIGKLSEVCCKLIGVSREKEIQENRDSQLQEIQKLRKIQEDMLESNKRQERDERETQLLQTLMEGTGEYKRYKDLNQKRVPGTCEWFLTDERFHTWRDNQSSSLLWVSAGPGYGKSVLSKFLIDDGQLAERVTTITITPSSIDAAISREPAVCFFFFKERVDDCINSSNALCAILHQLFTNPSTSGLIKYALGSHREYGSKLTKNFSELWRILSACVASPDAGEIICVLDALDECKEGSRRELIETLKEFYLQSEKQSITSSKLKFLVTSRPYSDLENSFQEFGTSTAYLRFDGHEKSDQISQEINLVIDVRLKSTTNGFTLEDRQKISESLKSMDHRTYLWLHLTFDIIKNNSPNFAKRSDIEKLLSQLPSEVSDAYETILSRSTDRSRTEILLRSMLAAPRPLNLDEANFALTLATQEPEPERHVDIDLWPASNFQSTITNLCGLFVTVYDSKLFFIHQTARKFLLDSEKKGSWQGRFNMPQSHSTASQSCLRYLLLPDFDRPPEGNPVQHKQYPYFAYAAGYWPLHFVSQEATDANICRKSARMLCDTTKHRVSIWTASYFNQRYIDWEDWTDLALASYLGLSEVVQDILFKEKPDVDLEAKDRNGRTPLSLASEEGHEAVVKLLLQKGAEIDTKDQLSWTPLLGTAKSGHEAVVKLLLEKGAEIDTKDNTGRTPLLGAAELGHKTIVKLLLEKGAEIDAKDQFSQTPLSGAAKSGHEAVVKLILEKGAEIDTKNQAGQTPLFRAARSGHVAVVKLLLERGAEIDAKDDIGWTPLFGAARSGHEAVVKLLVEKGAEIDAKDDIGRTPLFEAAERGHKIIVKLLLEKGAEIDAKDDIGRTPLLRAAELGQKTIVKLLLEKGAEINAKDQFGRTPLLRAAELGHKTIVKLLLERRAEIDAKDQFSQTPLSGAAKSGHEAVVKLILEKGAEIDSKNQAGQTPLL